jgi:predicted nucleic acid-binding protein
MPFIVDASMAAAWILPDEYSPAADTLLQQLVEARARTAPLFWYEVRNILLMAERRKRIGVGESVLAMNRLRRLSIEEAGPGKDAYILALATKHMLSAYDATYLALALDENLPLATLDQKLAVAARLEAVTLLGPLATP